MHSQPDNIKANKTNAGKSLDGICRIIDASRSPSPHPRRYAPESYVIRECGVTVERVYGSGAWCRVWHIPGRCRQPPDVTDRTGTYMSNPGRLIAPIDLRKPFKPDHWVWKILIIPLD